MQSGQTVQIFDRVKQAFSRAAPDLGMEQPGGPKTALDFTKLCPGLGESRELDIHVFSEYTLHNR